LTAYWKESLVVPDSLRAVRRYLVVVIVGNFAWEILQLPLYTMWYTGTVKGIAVAVLHCTAGDFIIATAALIAALCVAGDYDWPARSFGQVALVAFVIGLTYTIFSEWLNIVIRKSWAYSDWMPVVPLIGTGVSPLTQWVVVPGIAMWWSKRARSYGLGRI
jgi:hypothetical protein